MNKNEKFVHFLESLITDENQSLIEAIYEGFETITEANRYEQEMAKQDTAAGVSGAAQQTAKIAGRQNIASTGGGAGSNQQMAQNANTRALGRYKAAPRGTPQRSQANQDYQTTSMADSQIAVTPGGQRSQVRPNGAVSQQRGNEVMNRMGRAADPRTGITR